MRRIVTGSFFALWIFVLACGSAGAQATAQISGTVQDPSGAVLPGVEISATQTDTGVSRMTVSNETGIYVLPNLPLGPYKLEATLPGFRSFVQTGIVLQVNTNPTINILLQVGQVSEQVQVEANASLVETRNVSVGQVMETARIMELPLNGRNAQELLLLGGGTVQSAPAGGNSFPGRLTIASAGSLGVATDYTLDGIRHVDPYDGLVLPLPFPDALAEFKAEIGGLSAQQGRSSQVSAVTKSGTNEFHGDAFEFVRNDLFNAKNYFATKGSTLKRNQFGGTLGGSVIKNKLFFFGGYQGTTLRQDPADQRQFVPTAAMMAGDFTAIAAPVCNAGRQITMRPPFVNNRIDPKLFDPVALKVVARLPTTTDPCGQITFGRKTNDDQKQIVSKVDYQWSAKHSLFGRYLYSTDEQPSAFIFTPNNILNATQSSTARSYAFTAGSTYLINPTTVNAFRLSFSRNYLSTPQPQFFDLTSFGANIYSGYAPNTSSITITNGFNLNGGGDRTRAIDFYQLADDVSLTRGKHQFGFGGNTGQSRTNVNTATQAAPNFIFDGSMTGLGLADFLVGKPLQLIQGTGNVIFTRAKYFSMYVQDTWQVKPRLTLNYGLRWAPMIPHQDIHRPVPFVEFFDMNRYLAGQRSSVFVNAPPGILFSGDPGFPLKNNGANAAKPVANISNPYWKDFAPRLGFAWDVQGNGRTSVRASYGLSFYDYPTIDRLGTQQGMPPYGSGVTLNAPVGGLDDPWQGVPGGDPFPLQVSKTMSFVPFGAYLFRNPDLPPTYIQSWNLNVQREVMRDTLVSISYIGSHITHLQIANPLNLAQFVPGNGDANGNCFLNGASTPYKVAAGAACSTLANTQSRRALGFLRPQFANEIGQLAMIETGGNQHYNGVLLSFQRRFSHGVSINANHTFSHCLGDYAARTSNGFGTSVNQTYQDPNNRHKDYGNCEIDQRHSFNLTAVAETPKFGNRTLDQVGSGWRLSTLYRKYSNGSIVAASSAVGVRTVTIGTPSAATTSGSGGDRCLCDIANQRPNLLLPDAVYLDKSGRPNTQYLNPSAFGLPALGTLGNLGRATLTLPPIWQFDVAVSRVFHVRENQSVEFRTEAFNVVNGFRTGAVDTNLSSAQFGRIRNAQDPRILQFALKYLF